jgi:hypothetical protein
VVATRTVTSASWFLRVGRALAPIRAVFGLAESNAMKTSHRLTLSFLTRLA